RFSPNVASAAFSRSVRLSLAACFSFKSRSKRSLGLSVRLLKNPIGAASRITPLRSHRTGSKADISRFAWLPVAPRKAKKIRCHGNTVPLPQRRLSYGAKLTSFAGFLLAPAAGTTEGYRLRDAWPV